MLLCIACGMNLLNKFVGLSRTSGSSTCGVIRAVSLAMKWSQMWCQPLGLELDSLSREDEEWVVRQICCPCMRKSWAMSGWRHATGKKAYWCRKSMQSFRKCSLVRDISDQEPTNSLMCRVISVRACCIGAWSCSRRSPRGESEWIWSTAWSTVRMHHTLVFFHSCLHCI